jgi:hypothetical protein
VVASDGGAPCSTPRVNVRWLPRVLYAPNSASGGGDCSPNSWRPSIAARIDGRWHATTVARVLGLGVFVGQNPGDIRRYL